MPNCLTEKNCYRNRIGMHQCLGTTSNLMKAAESQSLHAPITKFNSACSGRFGWPPDHQDFERFSYARSTCVLETRVDRVTMSIRATMKPSCLVHFVCFCRAIPAMTCH